MSDLALLRPVVARNGIVGVDATRFEVLVGLGGGNMKWEGAGRDGCS